ncbi:MAG: polyprenyl diphosphate synthase [Patescibacteria group bacterium]
MPKNNPPQHVAIICDGNRRWAKSHGWDVIRGHEFAFDKIFIPLARHAADLGIKYLTFWVFSTENWGRERREVDALMNIFRHMFDEKAQELEKENVVIKTIGDISKFDQDIQEKVKAWVEKTKNNTGITVTFAMNYGGRDELLRAFSKLIANTQYPISNIQAITKEDVSNNLDTAGTPDPDLIVRTSGEHRLSGFMLWQAEYSEFYFPKWNFPEFTPEKLDECVEEYQKRKIRRGK